MWWIFLMDDTSPSLEDRIGKLEEALVLSLDKWQAVAERLRSQFGDEVLGSEMSRLLAAGSDSDLKETVTTMDRLVKSGNQSGAARLFRDVVGCTWDQAHHAIGHWPGYSKSRQLRGVRLARYLTHLQNAR